MTIAPRLATRLKPSGPCAARRGLSMESRAGRWAGRPDLRSHRMHRPGSATFACKLCGRIRTTGRIVRGEAGRDRIDTDRHDAGEADRRPRLKIHAHLRATTTFVGSARNVLV